MSLFGLLLFVLLLICIIMGIDIGYIYFSEECFDVSFEQCAQNMFGGVEKDQPKSGTVTAIGTVSGEYGGENRSVTFTMNIPLEGGAVSGSFSGDCDGTIKGTFAGGDSGAISGTGKGSCAFVIPASGSFSGSVNQSAKTVPISGSGSAAGFSGSGSLTLTYK